MSQTSIELQVSNEWHVLKGETQYGPYDYGQMIQMMQSNVLFDFDYVWSPHLEEWTHLAHLTEFSMDRISRIAEKNLLAPNFADRKHERKICKLPVFVSDTQQLWNGLCENISAGGALILIQNPLLLPGHNINIHFRTTETETLVDGITHRMPSQSFNTKAEILSKRLTKQRIQHDTSIRYAVRFLQLSPVGEMQIQQWLKNVDSKGELK